MNVKILINDNEVSVKEKTLRVFSGILTTDNLAAKTVQNAVELAGGMAYVESFAQAGDESDVFVCVREITRRGNKGTITGKATRANIAERMRLALKADTFAVEIVTDIAGSDKSESDDDDYNVEVI